MKVLAKFGRVVAGAIVIVTVGFSSTVAMRFMESLGQL